MKPEPLKDKTPIIYELQKEGRLVKLKTYHIEDIKAAVAFYQLCIMSRIEDPETQNILISDLKEAFADVVEEKE